MDFLPSSRPFFFFFFLEEKENYIEVKPEKSAISTMQGAQCVSFFGKMITCMYLPMTHINLHSSGASQNLLTLHFV